MSGLTYGSNTPLLGLLLLILCNFFFRMGRRKMPEGQKKTSAQKSKERRDRLKREDPEKFYGDERARKKESKKRTLENLDEETRKDRTAMGTVYVSVMAYIFTHVIT